MSFTSWNSSSTNQRHHLPQMGLKSSPNLRFLGSDPLVLRQQVMPSRVEAPPHLGEEPRLHGKHGRHSVQPLGQILSQHRCIRVSRSVHYRPGTFRSRAVEWEKTVYQDASLLGFTTEHMYFSGQQRKYRIRNDGSLTSSRSPTGST